MTTVLQFGMSPGSGLLSSIVDGDVATGWSPLAYDLSGFTAPFFSGGVPNVGASFAGFQFDFGVPVRIPVLLLQTESDKTLARSMIIASDNPATSAATMVQSGDELLGVFSEEQMNAGRGLITRAAGLDIRKRYLRICMRSSRPEDGDTSDPGFVDPAVGSQFDVPGSGFFTVPEYASTFVAEGWGGGASAGLSAEANAGGDTSITFGDAPLWQIIAHGGGKSSASAFNSGTGAAVGGTASGGTLNESGQNGGTPTPANGDAGLSGEGGDSPSGGSGGEAIVSGPPFRVTKAGNNGNAPGGGGSGRLVFGQGMSGVFEKYPGGAAGAHVKKIMTRGASGSPEPGDVIGYQVAPGGAAINGNGAGAPGRVKFSWT